MRVALRVPAMSRNVASSAYKHFHSPENASFYKGNHYRSLKKSNQEIRLLQIQRNPQGAGHDAPISFKLLQPVPLAEAGCFIAVSYRAGDPTRTVPVLVDGQLFNVFESLGSALTRVIQRLDVDEVDERDLTMSANIWADQICINQSDGEEKASQVQLMKEIYAKAIVFAWLGKEKGLSAGLYQMNILSGLQELAEKNIDKPWGEIKKNSEMYEAFSKLIIQTLHRQNFDWGAVGRLLQDPFWSRAWIAQELLVGGAMTLNTDTQELSREMMAMAMRIVDSVMLLVVGYFDAVDDGAGGQELVLKDDPVVPVDQVRDIAAACRNLAWLRESRTDFQQFFFSGRDQWKEGDGLHMETLMLQARRSQVTDPLDRVYAFLGLAKGEYDIVPSYGPDSTVEKTYIDAAKAAIEADGDLDMLSFAEERSQEMSHSGGRLPSWVPDWNPGEKTCSLRARVQGDPRRPTASGGTAFSGLSSSDDLGRPNRILTCKGIVVDKVADSTSSIGETLATYSSWESCVSSWAKCTALDLSEPSDSQINRGDYAPGEDESRITAFWSTICRGIHPPETMRAIQSMVAEMGGNGEGEGNAQGDAPTLGGLFMSKSALPNELTLSTVNMIYSSLPDQLYLQKSGFRFFCSPRGFYGLARARVSPGDMIAVFLGASVPFVVRPYKDGYLVMGEAYVHGIMYGEVLDEVKGGVACGAWVI